MKKKNLFLAMMLLLVNLIAATMIVNAATEKLERPVITLSNIASTGKIKISWEAIEGAESYKVYRSTDDGETYKLLSTTTKTSLKNTSAVAGKKYYYKVKAIAADSAANSSYSKAKGKVCDLARPVITVSTIKSTGKIKVSWKAIDKAKSYKVYRSTDGGETYKMIKETTKTSLTNTSVTTGKEYFYKVKAISSRSSADSAYSKVKSIRCGQIDGEELTTKYIAKSWVSIYEKANSDSTRISLPYMEEIKLGMAVSNGSSGKWCRIFWKDQLYYIWLVDGDGKLTSKKSSFEYEGENKYQQQVLDLAVDIAQNWKTTYTHGESNGVPNEDGVYGFDCSGFVSYVINTVMQKEVPTFRLSSAIGTLHDTDSVYNDGYPNEFVAKDVKLSEIQPGDILFFSQESGIDHCALYLGNNEFAHSSHFWDEDSVCIMPLKDGYKEDLVEVRRYIPSKVSPANKKMYVTKVCKMYEEKSSDSTVVYQFKAGETVTVLYTDNGNWAQVKNEDGLKAYMLLKNLSEDY